MLKTVITCLQDISAELVAELELNHVSVRTVEAREDESVCLWCERALACLREAGILAGECILIASDRERLQAADGLGVKCIGYTDAKASGADSLLGCCEYVIESWDGIDFSYINRVFCRLEGIPLVIAETERLIIREMVTDDVPALCEICLQDSVRAFIRDIGDDIEEEAEKHRAYIEQACRFYDYGYWGVYDRKTGELIGRCGIQDNVIDGTAEIELGYLLAEEQRGKGYAREAVSAVLTYAFQELDISRVVAVIDKKNTASLHVAKNCGMLWEKDIVKSETGEDIRHICSVYAISSVICN